MKRAEYNLPFGVHPLLEPQQTGTTPETKAKDGSTVPGKPIYAYKVVTTPEAENLAEFNTTMVEQDKPESHTLKLAQGQIDIIRQRKIREWAGGQECSDLLDGKDDATKGLDEAARVDYALKIAQQVGDEYVYGVRVAATGGVAKAAKESHAKLEAVRAAAASDPEVAKKLAAMNKALAELGIQL